MNCNCFKKKSFVLLEVIISLVLFSVLVLGTVEFIFSIRKTTEHTTKALGNILKLEATRLFLTHNTDLSKLNFIQDRLYYKSDLLLDKVSKYQLQMIPNIATINICLDNNSVCQVWKIRL